jgi:hypothetical protein
MADEPHQPQLFDGTLPGATGEIGRILAAMDMETQRTNALQFHEFLINPESELLTLNGDNTPRTCIISLPNSSKVRVIHCIGIGSSAIGSTSPLDNKLLSLTGDGGHDIGAPAPLVLPKSAVRVSDVVAMSHELFCSRIAEKGPEYSWPLASRAKAVETGIEESKVPIMMIASIPSFLVYDGLTGDIDAALLYERVLSLADTTNTMYTHLKHFLLSTLTAHNQGDHLPHANGEEIFAMITPEARRWAKEKFDKCFPTLAPPPPQAANNNQMDMAALLAQFLAQQGAPRGPNRHREEEKKEDDGLDLARTFGMSTSELKSMLVMCGKEEQASPTLLPSWVKECAEKGHSEGFKYNLISKAIMKADRYDDVEVPLTQTLLKMADKRKWAGKDGNVNRPSLLYACEGLSPFQMVDMSDDEVASINANVEAIDNATSVSVSDIQSLKKKMHAKVPSDAGEFLTLLKRYANLLVALFSADCPLFQCVVTIITALRRYSPQAHKAMTQTTKASILWVILKQSRIFAIGETDILAEFKEMQRCLAAKSAAYSHAETPAALINVTTAEEAKSGNKRKADDNNVGKGKEKDQPNASKVQKAPPRRNPNSWHPKLKAALEAPLQVAGHPSFSAIFQYCNTSPDDLFPKWGKRCGPNAFFGKCYHATKCEKEHTLPSEKEIEQMLKLVDKFITKPSGLRAGR